MGEGSKTKAWGHLNASRTGRKGEAMKESGEKWSVVGIGLSRAWANKRFGVGGAIAKVGIQAGSGSHNIHGQFTHHY